jgi:N-carbamoylputrescine amidase
MRRVAVKAVPVFQVEERSELARIALAQVDCVLGGVGRNLEHARQRISEAAVQRADLVVFPELALHGYALGHLIDDRSLSAEDPRLLALADQGIDVLIGFHEDGTVRRYNASAYLGADGTRHVQRKLYLPTYLVWEERKHASPGQSLRAFDTRLGRAATLICNDAWQPPLPWLAVQDGAEVLLVPTNSAAGLGPESLDTIEYWSELLHFLARMLQCFVVFCNRVGTEAGASFWGGSRIVDPYGEVVAQAPLWEPALLVADVDLRQARQRRREIPLVAEGRLGLIKRELERLILEEGDA